MAQKPARRHALFTVREKLGLTQAQLGAVLDCSGITVQRIEQGTLRMSEDLALKAQEKIDISAAWLLSNDRSQLPVTPRGNLWSKDFYELTGGTPIPNIS